MAEIDQLVNDLFARPVDEGTSLALVVLQGGAVVAERYGTQPATDFGPAIEIGPDTTLISWSMAKSITHAAVGALVGDGRLDVEAPAPVPEWAGTPKAAITTLQLLEMRSGLRFVEDYVDGDVSHCIEMLFGDSGPSHAAYAAGQLLDHAPGEVWNYSSGTSNIVSRIVGDVVHGGSGGSPHAREQAMRSFLTERIFAPSGMTTAQPKFDGAGDFVGSSYVYATAHDFARFGEMYRNDGMVAVERVLPAGWAAHAGQKVATDPDTGFGYGRHWWSWPDVPQSMSCHGYEGQFIVVAPESETVLVHLGKTDVDVAPALRSRLGEMIHSLS